MSNVVREERDRPGLRTDAKFRLVHVSLVGGEQGGLRRRHLRGDFPTVGHVVEQGVRGTARHAASNSRSRVSGSGDVEPDPTAVAHHDHAQHGREIDRTVEHAVVELVEATMRHAGKQHRHPGDHSRSGSGCFANRLEHPAADGERASENVVELPVQGELQQLRADEQREQQRAAIHGGPAGLQLNGGRWPGAGVEDRGEDGDQRARGREGLPREQREQREQQVDDRHETGEGVELGEEQHEHLVAAAGETADQER